MSNAPNQQPLETSPLRLRDLPGSQQKQAIAQGKLRLATGPFIIRLHSNIPAFQTAFARLYQDVALATEDGYTDFNISVHRPRNLRRWIRPQVIFDFDGHHPFLPLPLNQALPVFEWGFNWCIANHAHQYLQFHAAGLAKDNVMVLMPAPPGSGKSTLTAALMHQDWQLLSDEIVLLRPDTLEAVPLTRPINLKNNSISLLKECFPDTYISDSCTDTAKGMVALMAPSLQSLKKQRLYHRPTHIIFPKYAADTALKVETLSAAAAGIELMRNSFNYHMLGESGFDTLVSVLRGCQCLSVSYSRFEDAFRFFETLEA